MTWRQTLKKLANITTNHFTTTIHSKMYFKEEKKIHKTMSKTVMKLCNMKIK